jgi:hypothetical protein
MAVVCEAAQLLDAVGANNKVRNLLLRVCVWSDSQVTMKRGDCQMTVDGGPRSNGDVTTMAIGCSTCGSRTSQYRAVAARKRSAGLFARGGRYGIWTLSETMK